MFFLHHKSSHNRPQSYTLSLQLCSYSLRIIDILWNMFSLSSLRCYGVKFQRGKYTMVLSTLSKARSHHCAIHQTINLKLKESSSRQFSNSSQDQQNTKPSSWIESEYVPTKIRPYLHLARADKQAGTLLLMWPCFWYAAYNHFWFYSRPLIFSFPHSI